ncbi:MAG: SIS domain-containing protein [Halobacteriovoraceae bacterium]|nr:SIS domain-containing protein [Halobacteriovoraceae bacterium]
MSFIENTLSHAQTVLKDSLENSSFMASLEQACSTLIKILKKEHRVFSCGNGGSLCDAMHFAEELTGRFQKNRKPLPAMAIIDPGHISCVGNDYGFEQVYSRYLQAWGSKGDLLLAITTSGNSPNVLSAIKTAREKDMKIIGLLGKEGGKAKELTDVSLIVPSNITHRIQEVHIKLIQILIEAVERHFFPELYSK